MNGAGAADDTIFALSSGAPPAAIAIVRVSGPHAARAMTALAGKMPPPRMATVARLVDGAGEPLDRALILWFPGPATATGEDLAEFHLHGGKATIAAALQALGRLSGLRVAEPGEFTRRALANGRIDLAQTEGLADLLQAETESQRRAALRMAEGGLSGLVANWSERLLTLSAAVEAVLEFSEDEEDVPAGLGHLTDSVAAIVKEVGATLRAPPAERLRDGLRVVIAGPVNAGKSSLLNALVGREAAIATPLAGTTRDLIEVPVIMAGIPIVLIDSAGLRPSEDEIERIGVDRAYGAVSSADLILWLGDPAAAPQREGVILIQARCDLPDQLALATPAQITVSARSGEGMPRLIDAMLTACHNLLPSPDRIVLNLRQRQILHRALASLQPLEGASAIELVIVAERLRMALDALGELTGRGGVEEMLDALFSRFCIGK